MFQNVSSSPNKLCNNSANFRLPPLTRHRIDDDDERRGLPQHSMTSVILLLCASLLSVAEAAASGGGARPLSGTSRAETPKFVDFVIDIPSSDDIQISDVAEDGDEEAHDSSGNVLCIAPPCGIKMKPVPADAAPVPWIHRLLGPEIQM